MLIDLHTAVNAHSPADLAVAVAQAGLGGAVLVDTHQAHRLPAYKAALEAAGLLAFVGVKLQLERGDLLLIPSDASASAFTRGWAPPNGYTWPIAEALKAIEGFDGAVIASHPYYRDGVDPLGDRIYAIKHIHAVECTYGEGVTRWDALAREACQLRGYTEIASSGGEARRLGLAAMVFADQVEGQADLVKALTTQACWPVEFEARGAARARPELEAPPPPRVRDEGEDDDRGERRPRRDDDRGERRPRRDDDRGERRPRRDDDRGGRGERRPRRDDDRSAQGPRRPRRDA
ncbi:hypothetical protein KKF91_16950 [Myxococcota bacterium]|nr:hypothetical protein [Myxococcota bacterium]MBU1432227.1 hypothetical protein [Myxococcota bacterium]MBU1896691.1 hypothetical protein [Myxococcota bacterium]